MSRPEYSSLDRFLHRLALGQRLIAEASFDIDQAVYGNRRDSSGPGRHVFVAGLARAGTTVLMRRLYASGAFRSLTYRDMPFVLMPRLWRKLSRASRRTMHKTERAHGDGLLVDYDSPEALEEVFWRIFDGEGYIGKGRLRRHAPEAAVLARYAAYVQAVLDSDSDGRTRYLAKNNNNILRLPAIAAAFPQAALIVPFRDPLQQANSLFRQHRRFLEEHRKNAFALQYMGWLAHHEFGADHRPFVFTEGGHALDPVSPDYWLQLWIDTYDWLLHHRPDNAVLLGYESLCAPDSASWSALVAHVQIEDRGDEQEAFSLRQSALEWEADPQRVDRARELYTQLCSAALGA